MMTMFMQMFEQLLRQRLSADQANAGVPATSCGPGTGTIGPGADAGKPSGGTGANFHGAAAAGGIAADASTRHGIGANLAPSGNGNAIIVNAPIIVPAGKVFDGRNQLYRGGPGLGDGSQNEHQQPMFIVQNGGRLENVRMTGGGDGVHFLGDGSMHNCINEDVSEDAVTIDDARNRAHDAKIAGYPVSALPARAKLEIDNCTFDKAHDKVIQDNGAADVTLKGVCVDGAGKVFRTNGNHREVDSHVQICDSSFKNVKEAVFRTDAPGATVSFQDVAADAPYEALVPSANQASGADRVGYKAYSG
ncbi:pectate lyase [Xanthomonas hyacinthi]|uniref:Pectate lyase n=2 Tax=Xanthomonas hyacinthi TaxID=56455 RepID=A0A2S7EZE8_9XANT|nr:hypothetical protein XhyaCFBP1156_06635 [Xanthomonas hyacinthi]QGY79022.1 pectate lyase [Xanthomonas hyacinthi]